VAGLSLSVAPDRLLQLEKETIVPTGHDCKPTADTDADFVHDCPLIEIKNCAAPCLAGVPETL
jgi:hypothetical protein